MKTIAGSVAAAQVIAGHIGATSGRPVVLIDGGSGSGKTTLADRVAELSPDAQLVHGDDLYPGWTGLSAVWDLGELVIRNRYQRWDWYRDRFAEEVSLDAYRPLVIEGCGVLTATNAKHASMAVWCSCPYDARRDRALGRDEFFVDSWAMWAAQERLHQVRHHPEHLADVVVDLTLLNQ
ncbi:hypothetical protein JMX58_01525 [Cutibacterium avidum]|uniref:Uncharacterized protein n=1 Tax=Cutibacterium avidum ATCC 25577 TaxID=997355 RepID=G4CXV0_9ACTN|nr:hypothetical protein HMPREF9153_1357 [Cutibacterium avidum ATCC 25577]OIJ79486.1 aminobenzoate synthetase [Cutibacterium avidum]QRH10354.1 hypothetical protein JMX58_01525 [Cutibacterium avidum]